MADARASARAGDGPPSAPAAAPFSFAYRVCLNPLDCNLDMVLERDNMAAHTLSQGACGYCWSGVRANLGLLKGLPGAGKSTWAARHAHALQNQALRYLVLGPGLVLEQMRLLCPRTRRFHYPGSPEEVFALAADALARQADRAPALPRNYILDRTHVTSESRRDAAAPFREAGFSCVCVAVVVAEAALFAQQKAAFEAEGKVVPDEVMAHLRANFTVPHKEEGFDEVLFPCLDKKAALAAVNRQRKEARAWLEYFQPAKQRRRRRQLEEGGQVEVSDGGGGTDVDMDMQPGSAAANGAASVTAATAAAAAAAAAGMGMGGGMAGNAGALQQQLLMQQQQQMQQRMRMQQQQQQQMGGMGGMGFRPPGMG
ncbi:hypothetical protein GPECTOR_15g293 [Gonium pectorale]|uniref:Uncharacterized protein n=1 Tax=Gonium pectorale TaxID=33097 RepID=A0A150GMN7_GONPE|nr:hypothetical protein GPECTOR_15g293 [Gonium pectorale]|eukprot:KXZ50610.1 hypothetical protein GPECTOR_15g293 [Gonium pectorale]